MTVTHESRKQPFERAHAYADLLLEAMSGVIPTPEEGYVVDGGAGLASHDVSRFRERIDSLLEMKETFDALGLHLADCPKCGRKIAIESRLPNHICGHCGVVFTILVIGQKGDNTASAEDLKALLTECRRLLQDHHKYSVAKFEGKCPACAKSGSYPHSIFARIARALGEES